jgi:hypothetical protein
MRVRGFSAYTTSNAESRRKGMVKAAAPGKSGSVIEKPSKYH